ncbi:hypothetical protein SDC9_161686 [bioreactor metagenome]|uniref:Uncharacterized protein n=1 Tax=bioreactor metagenome TaxID=1076179 RepID=A0A645FLY2_9ZZZZ
MQSTRYFVAILVEFTTRVQYRHYDFQGRFTFLFMHVDRNTTSIVHYSNRIIFVDGHINPVAMSSHCFVNRVVHNFIYQMV